MKEEIKIITGEETLVLQEPQAETKEVATEERTLRQPNKKVFQTKDAKKAVFYGTPVHFQQAETNSLEEIDNTLVEEEDGKHFKNAQNSFTARFSKETDSEELFFMEKDNCRITLSLPKQGKQSRKGIVPMQKAADGLIFQNVGQQEDLEYVVRDNGVKENIVLKDKTAPTQYTFRLQHENLDLEFCKEEKELRFFSKETGTEVFRVPAPFMTDANGNDSDKVAYIVKNLSEEEILLTIVANKAWLQAEDRVYPVVIDPQVVVAGATQMTTYSWQNGTMTNSTTHTIGTTGGENSAKRMYLSLNMPTMRSNPRIQKAELVLTQKTTNCFGGSTAKIGLYQVTDTIKAGTCTPTESEQLLDYEVMQCGSDVKYTFDVTTLLDQTLNEGTETVGLVVKSLYEDNTSAQNITLYGVGNGSNQPQLVVTYTSSYGSNGGAQGHTHELGRLGSGSVDLKNGSLTLTAEDFAWGGNRMPVTLQHTYNSGLSQHLYTNNEAIALCTGDFSNMHVGKGWRGNWMQHLQSKNFTHEGTNYAGYLYVDESGEEVYLKQGTDNDLKRCYLQDNGQCCEYYLYEAVNGEGYTYDPYKAELYLGEEIRRFADDGKLVQVEDAHGNCQNFTYTEGRLTSIMDGAGRVFTLEYTNGALTKITAPDESVITYDYDDQCLTQITYPDGRKANITYDANNGHLPTEILLSDAANNPVYKVVYSYNGSRVASVTEFGFDGNDWVLGQNSTFQYSLAARRTVVTTTEPADEDTEANVLKTVYTFDAEGNTLGSYLYTEDTGNQSVTGEGGSGIHPYSGDGGASVVSNINNLLLNHNFESLDNWTAAPENSEDFVAQAYNYKNGALFGHKMLRISSGLTGLVPNGIYQLTDVLAPGSYTFSAYAKVLTNVIEMFNINPGFYLQVTTEDGSVLAKSERIAKKTDDYLRLVVPFDIAEAQAVKVGIYLQGMGTVYVDAAQLENNPYANSYNMLINGNFEKGLAGWCHYDNTEVVTDTSFNMEKSLKMNGDISTLRTTCQEVPVKTYTNVRETFTLSGWAKACSLPERTRTDAPESKFQLRAEIIYTDGTREDHHIAKFSPCTQEWQLASVQFAKEAYKTIRTLKIYCDYSYNFGEVYFDDIQLVRNSIEKGLTASDFESISEVTDNEEELYEDESDATEEIPAFEEVMDDFGNALTQTTFTDGEFGTIYGSFQYQNGNDLIAEVDGRGNATEYTVDPVTSRQQTVEDRCGNKTAYEYDAAGRTTKVTSKDANDNALADVSYSYDAFDNLTNITRGDNMQYSLSYNPFHNLESIGIQGKEEQLVTYTYKNSNGRLKAVTYANGDTMKVTYNSIGQVVAEKWYSKANTLKAHYKYVYDGSGILVRSIDVLQGKEYTYYYEEGNLTQGITCNITLDTEERITKRNLENTIYYSYNQKGQQTAKRVVLVDGTETVYTYFQPKDGNLISVLPTGVTSHSKTDSFGRKVFDELQLGTGFVSRQFSYHAGAETEEHRTNGKLKSTATTQLVSQIQFADGRTLSYEYDAEERITKVIEKANGVETVTEYTYDAMGQLLTETVNGQTITIMTYDTYGNIQSKNGKSYTYGNSNWKDLLTAYDGTEITYDAGGNPLSYRGYTFTWEKGRQLKSAVGNDKTMAYTYNANGIRTSKTVNGEIHNYLLEGTKILRETCLEPDGKTVKYVLDFLYDNEDSICGLTYNGTPYYFYKNLQGDVIAITDASGVVKANYSYDAWGVCTITKDESDCNIATINPFRYRGYYMDVETELYYLQSRYYNPVVGRFINADEAEFINICRTANGTSLFAYCANNCINDDDSMGLFPVHIVAGVIMGILWAVLPRIISDIIRRKMSRISDYICDAIIGALYGLITSLTGNSTVASIISTFVGEMARFLIQNGPKLKTMTCKDVILSFLTILLKTLIAGFSDKLAGKIISKIRKKSFTAAQTRNYFKNTKYLKSAFGIGKGGKTGSRVWFKETGLSTVFANFLNNMFGI